MNVTGTIFDIKRYAIHDGPGIRSTVFFKGCPLDCWWCHNPEGRRPEPEKVAARRGCGDETIGRIADVAEVMDEILKDSIFYEESDGGITFSGGEPMMQVDFLQALLEACKFNNLHTALDTCGYAPFEEFEKIDSRVDLYLYDLKFIDDEIHQKYTGVANKVILENLGKLADRGKDITVRIPLIPGITDGAANLKEIARFVSGLKRVTKVSLLPYNKMSEDKFVRFKVDSRVGRLQAQGKADLKKIAGWFEAAGFKVSIGG